MKTAGRSVAVTFLFLLLAPGFMQGQAMKDQVPASPTPSPAAIDSGAPTLAPDMDASASAVPQASPASSPDAGGVASQASPDPVTASDPGTITAPVPVAMKVLYDLGFELVINQDPSAPLVPGDFLTTVTEPGAPAEDVHILVKSVRGNKIFARVVWSSRPVHVGDVVKKLDRLGIDIDAFAATVLEFDNAGSYSDFYLEPGVRLAWTWGLYGFRPALRLGFPFGPGFESSFSDISQWFPLSAGLDLEYSYYIDRLRIQPLLSISGITCLPLAGQAPIFAGMRVEGALRIGLNFDQWTELFVEAGYLRHFGERMGFEGGLHFGLGLTVK